MEGGHSCFGLLVLVLFKEKQKVKLSGNINEFAIPLNHFYAIIKFNLYIFFGGGRMDKISGVKLSKMRFLYYGLLILAGSFALWLFLSEGKRLHAIEMEIMPSKQTFIINVESNGGNVQVFSAEEDVRVKVSDVERSDEQRTRLTIEGNIKGKTLDGAPVRLLLLGFDNTEKWEWEILSGVGLSSIVYDEGEMANIRAYSYVVIAFEIICLLLPFNNRKRRNYAKKKLLEFAGNAENQAAFEAGKRWFLIHDRRRYWNRCLELFLIFGLFFYFFQEYLYKWAFLNSRDGMGS